MKEAGYINEGYRYCMDYDFWLRLMKKHPLHNIPDPLSAFRIHGESKGGSQYKKQFKEELEVARNHGAGELEIFFHWLHNSLITGVYSFVK